MWIDYRSSVPTLPRRKLTEPFPARCVIRISELESNAIRQLGLAVNANPYRSEEQEEFIRNSNEIVTKSLTLDTKNRISSELNFGFGVVFIEGLPVDEHLPSTPEKGGMLPPSYKRSFLSELCLVGLGGLVDAEIYNFRQEAQGTAPLIDNVVPILKLRTQKGAGGFENNFPFHCESTWHRLRPDYVVLLGLREASDATTLVFSTEMLNPKSWPLNNLAPEGWYRMRAPDLYIQLESRGMPMGTPEFSYVPPIRKTSDGGISLNLNFNGTECLNEEALAWMTRLETLIEETAVGCVIVPGTAIIVNNDRTCHTRSGYSPKFKGNDRWFQRGYFKKRLWQYKAMQPSADPSIIERLVEKGWATRNLKLTPTFAEFIIHPDMVARLSADESNLAAIAFQLTPIQGVRVV